MLDKLMVHKAREENVLIDELGRGLPPSIGAPTAEGLILPRLAPGLRDGFLGAYRRCGEEGPGGRYDLGTPDAELRERLAEGLAALPGLPLPELYRATLRLRLDHSFFFDHPAEHVPGILLIEAARQFVQACWHRYGGAPLEGWQFLMSGFDTEFIDFVDIHVPATFTGRPLELERRRDGMWERARFEAVLSQEGRPRTVHRIGARIVSAAVFSRLRAGGRKIPEAARFSPHEGVFPSVTMIPLSGGEAVSGVLLDLSSKGFRCGFRAARRGGAALEPLLGGGALRARLDLGGGEIFEMEAERAWAAPSGSGLEAGFSFGILGAQERKRIDAAIAARFRMLPGREGAAP